MKTIIIILGLTMAALAQQPAGTTWKGLRFGMTESEVRQAYPKPLQRVNSGPNNQFVTLTDEYELYGEPLHAHAQAKLGMGDGGNLEVVNIIVSSENSGSANSLAITDTITDDLKSKYGEPVSQEGGGCSSREAVVELVRIGYTRCTMRWRSEGQNIDLVWGFAYKDTRLADLIVSYKPFGLDSRF
jgi:hypothetical protein